MFGQPTVPRHWYGFVAVAMWRPVRGWNPLAAGCLAVQPGCWHIIPFLPDRQPQTRLGIAKARHGPAAAITDLLEAAMGSEYGQCLAVVAPAKRASARMAVAQAINLRRLGAATSRITDACGVDHADVSHVTMGSPSSLLFRLNKNKFFSGDNGGKRPRSCFPGRAISCNCGSHRRRVCVARLGECRVELRSNDNNPGSSW